jgi:hypothetical protein
VVKKCPAHTARTDMQVNCRFVCHTNLKKPTL